MGSMFFRPLKDLVELVENVCSPSSCKNVCVTELAWLQESPTGQPHFSVRSPRCDHLTSLCPPSSVLRDGLPSEERGRVVLFFNFK